MKKLFPLLNPLRLKNRNYFLNQRKKFSWSKFSKIITKVSLGLIVFIIFLFIWYSKDLPTPGKIKKMAPIESTHIYDRNGKSIYDVSGDIKRTVIEDKDISDYLKKATIAAEDKDFYKHFGFSTRGILRSVYYNLTGKTGYLVGGSTITQQYVKNALLSSKKTFTRKIKELILTLEVETMFSKDQILTMYLNEIPYGTNAYGVEAASQTYFNKSTKDLTLAQAATIASLPKAPTYYSPYGQHPDKLKIRRDYILDRLVSLKYISQEDADKAKQEKIDVVPRRENITAPHFVFYVKERLIEMFDEKTVEEGGLKVTTSLDLDKQKIAEEIIAKNAASKLKKYNASNASLVHIDPKTGQIIAMVGSKDYFDNEHDGQVNVAISDRQPGSSFKPLVYATAFKDKYNPAYILWDVTTDFGDYTPKNYDGNTRGPVTIRTALANSLNIPAVKILYLAGINKVLDQVHKMGITTLNDPERYGLSLVLGGGEVKLLDMVTAYGVFANQGTLHETTSILKIEDKRGKVLYEFKPNKGKKEVLDPQIAYQISDILSDNEARKMVFGFTNQLQFDDRRVAVKTGTTSENRDAWTIGYTPSVAVGVWVGNNDNSKMGSHADGSVVAAPIWHEYLQNVFKDLPVEDFTRPEGIEEVTVDLQSNRLATSQSLTLIKDIFASWQVPKENDNIHLAVKVCKLCQSEKLANNLCPASQTETRTYTNLHSEQPDKSNWENPVLEWAKNNAWAIGSPPKEQCELQNQAPQISITSPKKDQIISGAFTITANITAQNKVKYVEFFLDDISIDRVEKEPFQSSYNANNLFNGLHTLKARVVDENDLSSQDSLEFIVNKDTTAPQNVQNVNLTALANSIRITWKNPADTDLAKINLYLSQTNANLGSLHPNVILATASSDGLYLLTGLTKGQTYYLTLRPVDQSDNENKSTVQYSAQAQ